MGRDNRGTAGPLVSVVGGGVIGITTAIHLELVGYETAIYAARVPFHDSGGPGLATTYAAASVIPGHVSMDGLLEAFERSQAVFALFRESGSMGVRRQPHFDLAEFDRPEPAYAHLLDGYEPVEDRDDVPRRPGAAAVAGWRFDLHFVETPTYLARCYALYDALGGEVYRRTLDRDEVRSLPGEALVNCAGLGARALFDDPRPFEAHVGHQVLATGRSPVRDPRGRLFSYSYEAAADTFPGVAGRLYAYPRMDALVLGGSWIPADVDPDEDWPGEIEGPTRTIDGVAVPARIVDTNGALLADYAGVDLSEAELTARYGYRPVRDLDGDGVRIEHEAIDGRSVVHNYGHGGAGVTLSWGSAAAVAALVRTVCEPADDRTVDVPAEFAVAERLAGLLRGDSV